MSSSQLNSSSFERRWVRNTKAQSFNGNFNQMLFHPLVFDDVVVAANNIDGLTAYSKMFGSKKWTFKTQGGVSNPGISVGAYIFFSTYGGRAIALNASTGKIFWSTDIEYPTAKAFVFENGRLYIHTQSDEVICLEASTGERVWTYKHAGGQKIQVSSANAPVLLGSLIITGFSDGSLVALEKYNGNERWSRRLNFQNRFRDLTAVTVFDKDKVLVGSYDDSVYSINGLDGTVLWKRNYAITSNFILTDDRKACASTIENEIICLDPTQGDQVNQYSTPSVATQLVYKNNKLFYSLSGGGIEVLDFESGKNHRYYSTAGVSSAPILDPKSNVLYFSSNAGNLYSLKYFF